MVKETFPSVAPARGSLPYAGSSVADSFSRLGTSSDTTLGSTTSLAVIAPVLRPPRRNFAARKDIESDFIVSSYLITLIVRVPFKMKVPFTEGGYFSISLFVTVTRLGWSLPMCLAPGESGTTYVFPFSPFSP